MLNNFNLLSRWEEEKHVFLGDKKNSISDNFNDITRRKLIS